MKTLHVALALLAVLPAMLLSAAPSQQETVFVSSDIKNIDAFRLDLVTGALTHLGQAAAIAQPSFMAVSPDHRILYAVSEGRGPVPGGVTSFAIAAAGKLTFLNRLPTEKSGPCYVEIDPSGKFALTANYGTGAFALYPIASNGELQAVSSLFQDQGSSINPVRQKGPHAHCLALGPGGRFAYGCDLGIDKVMMFKFDSAHGTLMTNAPPFVQVEPGAGPRHIAFHPNGRWAYLINEMACNLTVFGLDSSTGALRKIQSESTLPPGFSGRNTCAEVAVHPAGKFVYASNRGDDTIAVFGCDPETGRLTFIEGVPSGGKTPRHFEIDPTGRYLLAANQNSNTLVVFRIDANTGRLRAVGRPAQTDNPLCVRCLMAP